MDEERLTPAQKREKADQIFAQAQDQFSNEAFVEALESLNQAIELNSMTAYHLLRAQVHVKLSNWEPCLRDADQVLSHSKDNQTAFLVKATALFWLDRFSEAKAAFEKAEELLPAAVRGKDNAQTRSLKVWVRKCEAELNRVRGR